MRSRPQRSRAGGCDFAVDPASSAQPLPPGWVPRSDAGLLILGPVPSSILSGPSGKPTATVRSASEGDYVRLGPESTPFRALILRGAPDDQLGVVLPLDALFDDRLEDIRRWKNWLLSGSGRPTSPTIYRRSRLKLALRALDGWAAGAGYREIARGLFPRLVGRDREPSEAVLGRTIRLVRYGVRLMRGGYLDLLRPERSFAKRTPR